jgi:hypothetical protein
MGGFGFSCRIVFAKCGVVGAYYLPGTHWLPWPGTAYAVPQYPAVPDFFFVAPSDEKTVIG